MFLNLPSCIKNMQNCKPPFGNPTFTSGNHLSEPFVRTSAASETSLYLLAWCPYLFRTKTGWFSLLGGSLTPRATWPEGIYRVLCAGTGKRARGGRQVHSGCFEKRRFWLQKAAWGPECCPKFKSIKLHSVLCTVSTTKKLAGAIPTQILNAAFNCFDLYFKRW